MPLPALLAMPASELADWAGFERVHGPLLLHERVDLAAARICQALDRLGGGEASLTDFMPEWGRVVALPAQEQEPEEMIARIRAIQARSKD